MSVQTAYSNIAAAVHGQLYGIGAKDIVSKVVEAAAGIGFGIAVSRGTNPDDQIIPGGDATFIGITVRDLAREGAQGTGVVAFADEVIAPVIRKGYIMLECPTGCVPGDVANYVDATGVIDSGVAIAGETDIVGATWESTASAGGIALLRLA